MSTPADRGWGHPGRKHGDPQAREYGRRHITTITTDDGSRFSVRKEVAPILLGFLNEIIGRGYRIKGDVLDDWGWYVRPIAGSSTLSNHSWGLAVDVNALTNPQGRKLVTDMPAFVPEAAKRWGLRWGGTYSSRPDGMHFEWVGSRDDALRFIQDLNALAKEDLMRLYRVVRIPAPDDLGRQLVTHDANGVLLPVTFDDTAAVTIRANTNGTPHKATVQMSDYLGLLVLSFLGLDGKPVPEGLVGVIIARSA